MDRRRELAVVATLAVVGVALFAGFYGSFPSNTPPIEHDRADARETAAAFLDAQGYDVSGYSRSVTYGADETESVYVQRTVPREAVGETLREYRVKHWTVTYTRPLERERFSVAVDPESGDVVGFERTAPEEAPGGNLSRDAARERALSFLVERGFDREAFTGGEYQLVTAATTERPNRTDHEFVWRDDDRGVGEAPHEVRVEVHGDRVGAYDVGLAVPESFVHDHRTRQNYSLVPTALFFLLSGAFGLVALAYGLRYYKRGRFDGRYALAAGGTVAVLSVVGGLNGLPGVGSAVPPTIPPWVFYLLVGLGVLLGATVQGSVTFLAAGTGKRLAAEVLDRRPIGRLREARLDPERRRQVAYGTARGFLLAYALLGFYTLFYLVGTRLFDVWLPASDLNATAMTTAVPALVALVTGGVAAIWEETAYRLFAVPLCERYLKYTTAALVVPAFVWGLGHAGYAVLPVYARVVETTLIGVVLGYAFLRWDLVTTVSAHFTLNATVVAVPMLAAGGSLFAHGALSLGVAALPLVVGLAVVVSGRRSDATLALTWRDRRRAAVAASFAGVWDEEGENGDADGDPAAEDAASDDRSDDARPPADGPDRR